MLAFCFLSFLLSKMALFWAGDWTRYLNVTSHQDYSMINMCWQLFFFLDMLYWGCWKISWLPPTQSKCLSILTAPTPAAPVIIMMPTLAQQMTSVPNSTELSSSSCGTESWPFSDQLPQSRYTLFNNILFYHEHFFLPRGNWSCEYKNRNNFWAWWAKRQHHW